MTVTLDGQSLTLSVAPRSGAVGQTLSLGIRPEHIRIGADEAVLEVVPSVVERLGQQTIAYANRPAHSETFCMVLPGTQALQADQPIRAGFRATDCHLFDAERRAFPRRIDLTGADLPSTAA